MSQNPLLKDREAGAILHRSPRTLARWRSNGEGPNDVSIKGRPLYPLNELAQWIEGQLVKPVRSRGA